MPGYAFVFVMLEYECANSSVQLHAVALGLEYLHCNGVVHGDLRGVRTHFSFHGKIILNICSHSGQCTH